MTSLQRSGGVLVDPTQANAGLDMLMRGQSPFRFIQMGSTGSSGPVKSGARQVGEWWLADQDDKKTIPISKKEIRQGKDTYIVEAILGPARARAIKFVNNTVELESFDKNSQDFRTIMQGVDRYPQESYMWGVEVLFFIPRHCIQVEAIKRHCSPEEYAKAEESVANGVCGLFHFGKKSSRSSGDIIKTYPPGTCIEIGSIYIDRPTFPFWAPQYRGRIDPAPAWRDAGIAEMEKVLSAYANPQGGQPAAQDAEAPLEGTVVR